MTIKTGQKMYRVRGPDGRWLKKCEAMYKKVEWVDDEHRATFWKKLHHLKIALSNGIFSDESMKLAEERGDDNYLSGLPLAALKVYEYEVTIQRTGRRSRLTELWNFHVPPKVEELKEMEEDKEGKDI